MNGYNKKLGFSWVEATQEWIKNYFLNLIKKNEKGLDEGNIFLINSDWEKNKDWICFIILSRFLEKAKEEGQIRSLNRILDTFFTMRSRDFNYLDAELKENFPTEIEWWKKQERSLKKYWEDFVEKHKKSDVPILVKQEDFLLSFEKYKFKFNKKGRKITWQEWDTFIKVSFGHVNYSLTQTICKVLSHFVNEEPKKIEEIKNYERNKFSVIFDIDPKNVPDILLISEKDGKKIGIEITEVFSLNTEGGSLATFLRKKIEEKAKRSIKKHGKLEPEIAKSIQIKVDGIEIKGKVTEKDTYYFTTWKLPEESDNLNHLLDQLKKVIKDKNDIWAKKTNEKKWDDTKNIALWTVLIATFGIKIKIPIENKLELVELGKLEEFNSSYIYLFLMKKIYEKISKFEFKIGFGYLIISFLDHNYVTTSSLLDSYSPLYRRKREEATEEMINGLKKVGRYEISKPLTQTNIPLYIYIEEDISNFYIPIIDYKVKDLSDEIAEKTKAFKEKFGLDPNSIEIEELSSDFYLKINKS